MRFQTLGWIGILGALLSGCGSSNESAQTGGQTGSLAPSCGITPLAQEGQPVPAGDAAAILYTAGCPKAVNEFTLTASSGQPIAFQLEPLGNGAYLVRTVAALDPGVYQARTSATDTTPDTLTVMQAQPLPTTLGQITSTRSNCDWARFSLELSSDALAYASLLALEVSIDGTFARRIDYGTLALSGNSATFDLSRCPGNCFSGGAHVIQVDAFIAGEQAQPAPATTAFNWNCSDDACATKALAPNGGSKKPVLTLLGLGLAFLLRSRCKLRRRF